MLRSALILAALAAVLLVVQPAQGAQDVTLRLLPGVTYTRETRVVDGRDTVFHVVTTPRPGGLYELRPVLSNDQILGRETVSEMQRRWSPLATAVGVNGDLFNWDTGHPSGIVFRDGVLVSRPLGSRSSLGIGLDGLLRIARIDFFGTWQAQGFAREPLHQFNRPFDAKQVGVALFSPTWGAATPQAADAVDVVLANMPATAPNADLVATVVDVRPGGGTPIPPDGAVLQATGFWGNKLIEKAAPGSTMTLRLILKPWWDDVASAIGGGPIIVRDGQVVADAKEDFTPSQLNPRHPRTAVGQLADGRVLLVAVDGRDDESAGITLGQLGQELVRRGVVTGMALDAGGSTTIAFDGHVLNEPSDGAERPVSDALMLLYYGAYVPEATTSVYSPNGDGFGDAQQVSYKLVRPSTVSARLIAPGGAVFWQEEGPRDPGTVVVPVVPVEGGPALPEGRWRWVVTATDASGNVSGGERRFTLNTTIGHLRLSRRTLQVRAATGPTTQASFQVARRAGVRVQVESASGPVVRRLMLRRLAPGTTRIAWNGRDARGRPVAEGRYRIRVIATNALGKAELFGDVIVRRPKEKTFTVVERS